MLFDHDQQLKSLQNVTYCRSVVHVLCNTTAKGRYATCHIVYLHWDGKYCTAPKSTHHGSCSSDLRLLLNAAACDSPIK